MHLLDTEEGEGAMCFKDVSKGVTGGLHFNYWMKKDDGKKQLLQD